MSDSLEVNPNAIIKQIEESKDAMALWSDEKKGLFVKTFEQRTKAAQYIIYCTVHELINRATARRFLSGKHTKEIWDGFTDPGANFFRDLNPLPPPTGYSYGYDRYLNTVGGRNQGELQQLGKERAEVILKELPSLKKAVQIISPDTVKLIEKRDVLLEKGQKMKEELEAISEPIEMSKLDQGMTIGEFRKLVKQTDETREKLDKELRKIGKEGCELEDEINQRLYAGLPGLTEAVIKVIRDHIERIFGFDNVKRRIGEKVMFGDSEGAVTVLKEFEKDEVKISDDIKAEFSGALEKLQLAAKSGKGLKSTKKLTSGGK